MPERLCLKAGIHCACLLAVLFALSFPIEAQQADTHVPLSSEPEFSKINTNLLHMADAVLSQPVYLEPKQPEVKMNLTTQWIRNAPVSASNKRIEQLEPAIVPILEKHGVPAGLTAVVAVESGGNPMAISPKGARGLWQLMPQTARRYGLVVDDVRDERIDLEKSTAAAAQYLHDLYLEFGSWPLALAAYNWGEQNLSSAMRRTHLADDLLLSAHGQLPEETRAYVPAVLARWHSGMDRSVSKSISAGMIAYAGNQVSTAPTAASFATDSVSDADMLSTPNTH